MNNPASPPKLPYYLLQALGLALLVGWFYLMRQLGWIEWLTMQGPDSHKGSFNLLAIMLWMLPALLAWKYYSRLLHRWFDIGGQFDEDRHNAQYKDQTKPDNDSQDHPG